MSETAETETRLAARLALQQREAAILLGKLLELAGQRHLPAIGWTITPVGALHGECLAQPFAARRGDFGAWRDALAGATLGGPDTGDEHASRLGETRLVAVWKSVPVDLNPKWRGLRPGTRAPSVHVTLTASIWPDDDAEAGQ